jgi:hypothetical protein
MNNRIWALSGMLVALAGACSATLAVIDQQNTFTNSSFEDSIAAGQSFTPTLDSIDAAAFDLETVSGSSDVELRIFSGDGFSGSLLGTSATQTISTLSFETFQFNFASPIALTPGDVYTLRLVVTGGSDINEADASGNVYLGGVEYSSAGGVETGYDLVFSEGISAPEPATLPLCGAGLLLLIGLCAGRAAVMRAPRL